MGMIRGSTMTENLVTDIKLLKHLSGMPVVELCRQLHVELCAVLGQSLGWLS